MVEEREKGGSVTTELSSLKMLKAGCRQGALPR